MVLISCLKDALGKGCCRHRIVTTPNHIATILYTRVSYQPTSGTRIYCWWERLEIKDSHKKYEYPNEWTRSSGHSLNVSTHHSWMSCFFWWAIGWASPLSIHFWEFLPQWHWIAFFEPRSDRLVPSTNQSMNMYIYYSTHIFGQIGRDRPYKDPSRK